MKQIQLTKGYSTLVDDEDYERLSKHKWFAVETITGPDKVHVSAQRWSEGSYPNRHIIPMSYAVLELVPGSLKPNKLDHIDRNPLNNQKQNLRIISHRDNALNSDRVINAKGVYYDKTRNRWKGFLLKGDRTRSYVGTYKTEAEALAAVASAKERLA